MQVVRMDIPEVLLLEPKLFGDERGWFFESYNRRVLRAATGVDAEFVQDNHSRSARGVLRGLHYQIQQAQGKLVRVISGEIWDGRIEAHGVDPAGVRARVFGDLGFRRVPIQDDGLLLPGARAMHCLE
jgi:dTDP-4-dehydrorhamnose 3,5-epimerase